MPTIAPARAHEVHERPRASHTPATALFWRLLGFNALVFIAGAAVLVLSPATVSTPVSLAEVAVLTVGSALMLTVNAVLLRATLRPLDGLSALMERVDLLRPGQRLSVPGQQNVAHLVRTFNEMLDRLEHERGESSAHALAAQEGERQRIARELHDEIGQSLTAVLLGLRRSIDRAPADLTDELQMVQEMVRDSLDEVRMVARRLRPGVLDDLGLISALESLTTDFTDATGLRVGLRLDPDLPAFSHDVELVLYRIAQEGLTNVARHADAESVGLILVQDRDGVVMTITDNGRGVSGAAESSGIRGMRERAILIDANLTIDTPTTGGTVLRLVVPVAAIGQAR